MLQWESGGKIWCLDSSSSAQRVGYLHSKLRSLLVQAFKGKRVQSCDQVEMIIQE